MPYVDRGPNSTVPCRCTTPSGTTVCAICGQRVWRDPGNPVVRDVENYVLGRTGRGRDKGAR